jgi:hypothetical protein
VGTTFCGGFWQCENKGRMQNAEKEEQNGQKEEQQPNRRTKTVDCLE